MTHSDCYHMGNKPKKTPKKFLEEYKSLCLRYQMYIDVFSDESGMDIGQDVETFATFEELDEHIESIKLK